MAGAVSSVSSETMTALAALRTRFTLLRSTHRDPRQGWYYGGGTCGLLPPHILPGHLAPRGRSALVLRLESNLGTAIRTGAVLVVVWVMVVVTGSSTRFARCRVGRSVSSSPLGLRCMLPGSTAKMSGHLASELTAVFVLAM